MTKDNRTFEERELDARIEYANAIETHLDSPPTRRELIDILNTLARLYTSGNEMAQMISDMFKKIAQNLECTEI